MHWPIFSLTVFIATLRAVSEHQIGSVGGVVTGRAALRNLRSAPLTRLVFGCYGFAEHASHHEEPAIPYYHLGRFTERLARDDESLKPVHGYMATLIGLAGSGVGGLGADDDRDQARVARQ